MADKFHANNCTKNEWKAFFLLQIRPDLLVFSKIVLGNFKSIIGLDPQFIKLASHLPAHC